MAKDQPMTSKLLLAALALCSLASPVLADDTVTGDAIAIGPDIISIGPQRIVLLGIDAPEANQKCMDNSKIWDCAGSAFTVLDQTVKAGTTVCTLSGTPDPFGKRNGVCKTGDTDPADELVKQGLAFAYPHDAQSKMYTADESAAKKAGAGFWAQGITVDQPWVWRVQHNHTPFK
jgi:endonuclease YncB( thermonuclease family)